MAMFKPFKSIRPRTDLVGAIAALPYDVYSTKEAREAAKDNPYSFLHVDKAEIDLEDNVDLYSSKVYEKALENFNNMISAGWLVKDESEAFYIYRLEMNGRYQTGIAGLTSIDEYINGTIKKHEHTREDKENDRIRHIQSLNAQTGPIFIAYSANARIKLITDSFIADNKPIYEMSFDDGTSNAIWRVVDKNIIEGITSAVKDIPELFIADGHHRNASAVKVGLQKRSENSGGTGAEAYNYYLSVLFPDDELYIMDYNRVVKDLNGLSKEEFINKLSEFFDIYPADNGAPAKRHEFGLYIEGSWYMLKTKPAYINEQDVLARLDVSILQDYVLGPVLNITDVRTNKRIDFIGGIRGISDIERRVDSGEMKAGFALYPTAMYELMDVAKEDRVMPPKSTWFEPKLRSGIFIHEI